MPSSVATRITRSERCRVGQAGQHFGGLLGFEVGQHDGDDLRMFVRMISATCLASIHLSAFETLALASEADAIQSAGGLLLAQRIHQHLRTNSSPPTPTEVCCSTAACELHQHGAHFLARHVGEIGHGCARGVCTSLAPRCLRISAASLSPSVSNRMAARSTPLRLVLALGFTHRWTPTTSRPARRAWDRRRPGRAPARSAVRTRWRAPRDGAAAPPDRDRRQRALAQRRHLGGVEQAAGQRLEHAEDDDQQHHETGEHLGQRLRPGLFPDRHGLEFAGVRRRVSPRKEELTTLTVSPRAWHRSRPHRAPAP